jgi:hypothetical protein
VAAAPPKQLSLITEASVTALNVGDVTTCKLAIEVDEYGLGTMSAHSTEIRSCELHNGQMITLDQASAHGELCFPCQTTSACEAAPLAL